MRDILAIILIIVIIVIIIKNLGMNLSCSCSLKHKKSKQNFELPGTYEVPTDKVIEHQVLGRQEQSSGFPNFQARNWGEVVRTPWGGPTRSGPVSVRPRETYQHPGTYEVPPSQPNTYATLGGTKGAMPDGRVIHAFESKDKETFELPGTYEVPPSQPNTYTTLGARDTAAGLSGLGLRSEKFQLPGTYEVPPSQSNTYATLGGREDFALTRGFQSITAPYITDLNDQTTTYARVEQTRAKPEGEVYNDCYEYCVTNGDRPSVLYNFKNTAECAEKCFEAKYKM